MKETLSSHMFDTFCKIFIFNYLRKIGQNLIVWRKYPNRDHGEWLLLIFYKENVKSVKCIQLITYTRKQIVVKIKIEIMECLATWIINFVTV
jgi:hypothetical protein